jgi:adenosine deaminase
MTYQLMPKIELHLHLDCSLSYDVVKKIDPSVTEETYRQHFIAPSKCTDLTEYLEKAYRAVDLMQTEEQLRLVTHDLFRQLKRENVIYAEIRFAPLQHRSQGLSGEEVVRIVNEAAEEGIRETGVESGIILCTLRHYSEEESMETVRLVEKFRGSRITGFDIAADEAGFPVDAHILAFRYARENNIPCTAHAGEARGAESVRKTLETLKPSRIGHGVRSAEDAQLLAYLKEHNIHLEVCPTSNICTNVYNRMEDHAADKIYRSGVSMSINTDGRTISNTTLTKEYRVLEEYFSWDSDHFKTCNLEAINHAFTNDDVKEKLRKEILKAYP